MVQFGALLYQISAQFVSIVSVICRFCNSFDKSLSSINASNMIPKLFTNDLEVSLEIKPTYFALDTASRVLSTEVLTKY